MDNRDGVLPFGFVIQQPLVSARQCIQDIFQVGHSHFELLCAPFVAWFGIFLLELFVDEGNASDEIVRRRDTRVDQLPTAPVDSEPVREKIGCPVYLVIEPLLPCFPFPLREHLIRLGRFRCCSGA